MLQTNVFFVIVIFHLFGVTYFRCDRVSSESMAKLVLAIKMVYMILIFIVIEKL